MSEIITQQLLKELVIAAENTPRLRKNHNFHQNLTDLSQRLLIGIEPGSYIQPHRHLQKDETMLVVAGKMGLILFNEDGSVSETHILAPQTEKIGVNIKIGTFHSVVGLESGTIFFESKDGPYQALESAEIASWAPAESEVEAKTYYQQLQDLFL